MPAPEARQGLVQPCPVCALLLILVPVSEGQGQLAIAHSMATSQVCIKNSLPPPPLPFRPHTQPATLSAHPSPSGLEEKHERQRKKVKNAQQC